MSTVLRIIDAPPPDSQGYPSPWLAAKGDMWPCKSSTHVVEGRAPCWVIRLPDGAWVWHTNGKSTDAGTFWTVSGTPPKITVAPSINVGPEIWHGHIVDGVMTP